MTKNEYISQLSTKMVDEKKVNRIQDIYGSKLPDVVQKIISNNDESVFFEDACRILSYKEVVNAETDLHIDFKGKSIIPIADCGENDFIVYHFNDRLWSKFNIIDETFFKKKNALEDLLK